MLFNSLEFAVFLPIVFGLYWFVTQGRLWLHNLLVVAASYLFYGWWDWRFLSLIVLSTVVDFGVGLGMSKAGRPAPRRLLLWLSILVNLGLLGVFKYYDFFLESLRSALATIDVTLDARALGVVLPVGISFYTFQTLSYSIDVYRGKMKATRDPIAFAAFVGFFPQLVAGPIERATHLLPQFQASRRFDPGQAVDGLRQILWGLFKKMVIADNCAEYVDTIFANSDTMPGSALAIGAVLFAFQIYGDFSGYSDIAIGTARLFGFDLMRNFAFPYFSRDIAEFWRRWHISLSTWFRDYLYIPLGGSRMGIGVSIRNTFIIFLVSGFWHGANWTFLAWGALHALYYLPLLLTGANRRNLGSVASGKTLPSLREAAQVLSTFLLVTLAWVFFRAADLEHALQYLSGMASASLWQSPGVSASTDPSAMAMLLMILVATEWVGREKPFALSKVGASWPRSARWSLYSFLIFLIGMFMQTEETPFIYFQF